VYAGSGKNDVLAGLYQIYGKEMNVIFLDEKFNITDGQTAKYIVYEIEEHKKINEKLIQFKYCAKMVDNLQEKHNIIIDYLIYRNYQ